MRNKLENNMVVLNGQSGLFTDHYALTMAQGYFLDGRERFAANFDYFFRTNPFGSGYTVFAGLQDLLEMIQSFNFDSDSIDYLHTLGFQTDFLEYLKTFRFRGSIYAPNEGEIVFANEPIVRFEGNIIETQLIETLVLNTLNFQSLIATKASRIRRSAGKRVVMEFGMRRAQGLSAIHGSRAAVIGGVNSTSNVHSAYVYGLTSTGTQAHSWIQSYGDELTAFRRFAAASPNSCTLLVDTFDTLKSGVPNAVIVAKEMEMRGEKLSAIRLDSGDLAYLSKHARRMLDDAELTYVKIVASNQLDEYLIKSLIDQDAPIDSFGVGTSLMTGQKDAALDGVYKLSMADGRPTLKLSEDHKKITLPGVKNIYRYLDNNGKFYADGIVIEGESAPDMIHHPTWPLTSSIVKGMGEESLLTNVYGNDAITLPHKSIHEIADYVQTRLQQLPSEHTRFENPHTYRVGISSEIMNLRSQLMTEIDGRIKKGTRL